MNTTARWTTLSTLFCLATAAVAQTTPRHIATYLGGSENDVFGAVAVAPNGDLVVAGNSVSNDLPTTPGAFQSARAGVDDVFVARLSPDGSQVLALTYLGGSRQDWALGVEVGADDTIWIGGTTLSQDFPTSSDAFMAPTSSSRDAFVVQLDADLTTLLYATAFGGSGSDDGDAFVLDEANERIYLAGKATLDVPTTASALRRSGGSHDAYLAVLDRSTPGQTDLAYGTLLGGSGLEFRVNGLSVDGAGIATVTGTTQSSAFPTTGNAIQSSLQGLADGFVARIDPSQSGAAGLVYGSYFGGSEHEDSLRHAVDASGRLHLLLISRSPDLPATPNALLSAAGASLDAFYAQVDPTASGSASLIYGSWIAPGSNSEGQTVGNSATNVGASIVLGPTGPAFLLSTGSSAGLSTTPGAFQPSKTGLRGYAMVLDTTTGPDPFISYATHYLGCGNHVFTGDLALHPSGDLVMAGWSDNLPVTPGATQIRNAGRFDGFVSRLESAPWPAAFRSFGSTCPGTAGTPTLTGVASARLCSSMRLRATQLPPEPDRRDLLRPPRHVGRAGAAGAAGTDRRRELLRPRRSRRRVPALDRQRRDRHQRAGAGAARARRRRSAPAVRVRRPRCESARRGDDERRGSRIALVADGLVTASGGWSNGEEKERDGSGHGGPRLRAMSAVSAVRVAAAVTHFSLLCSACARWDSSWASHSVASCFAPRKQPESSHADDFRTGATMVVLTAVPLSTAAVLVFLVAPVSAQVLVVDAAGGPGAAFTDLPEAVDAAPGGATLRVRPGRYTPFSLVGKGLSIVGDTPGEVILDKPGPPLTVSDTAPGDFVLLENLSLGNAVFGPRMAARDNRGTVVLDSIDDDHVTANIVPSSLSVTSCTQLQMIHCRLASLSVVAGASARVRVQDSTVHLAHSILRGGPGVAETMVALASPGGIGLSVERSRVTAIGCDFAGGPGGLGACFIPTRCQASGDGGTGVFVAQRSSFLVLRGRVAGGDGSPPLPSAGGIALPSDGGTGIVVRDESSAIFAGAALTGGAAAAGTQPGAPYLLAQGGTIEIRANARPAVADLEGETTIGSPIAFKVDAEPGSPALLLVAADPALQSLEPLALGAWLARFSVVVPAGAVPGTGTLRIPYTIRAGRPLGVTTFSQFLTLDPASLELWASNALALHVNH